MKARDFAFVSREAKTVIEFTIISNKKLQSSEAERSVSNFAARKHQ